MLKMVNYEREYFSKKLLENPFSPGMNKQKNLKARKSKDSATDVLAERTNQVVSDLL